MVIQRYLDNLNWIVFKILFKCYTKSSVKITTRYQNLHRVLKIPAVRYEIQRIKQCHYYEDTFSADLLKDLSSDTIIQFIAYWNKNLNGRAIERIDRHTKIAIVSYISRDTPNLLIILFKNAKEEWQHQSAPLDGFSSPILNKNLFRTTNVDFLFL